MLSKKLVAVSTMAGLLLSSVAFAHDGNLNINNNHQDNLLKKIVRSLSVNANGSAHITGTVTAVNGSTLVVSTFGGAWTVNAQNAEVKGGDHLTLSSIAVGDVVMVKGTAAGTLTLNATSIHEKFTKNPKPSATPSPTVTPTVSPTPTVSVAPTVSPSPAVSPSPSPTITFQTMAGQSSNVNTTAGTFTISSFFGGSANVVTNGSTTFSLNGNTSTLATIGNSKFVVVSGSYNTTTDTITAVTVQAFSTNAQSNPMSALRLWIRSILGA